PGLPHRRERARFGARRRELAEIYQGLLSDLQEEVQLLTEAPGRRSSYHLLVARLNGQGGDPSRRRRQVFESLHRQGIRAQVHYIPVHLQPWYRERLGTREGMFPHAE